ncbi:MAG TPA: DUF4124 domain-containing protein [Cellvibrionaceae bacterium]
MLKLALIGGLIICSAASWAQVYSWQDEQGRTHYSDKPLDATAREQTLDIGRMPDMRELGEVVIPTFDDTFVPPLVGDVRYKLSDTEKLANFYFGGDCVSPTKLDYSDLKQRYRHALPPVDDLRRALAGVLQRSFSRGVKIVAHQNTALLPNKKFPFIQADIVEMRIYACAPVLPRQIPTDALSVFSLSMFKQSHTWLKINWSLISREDGEVVASVTTEGVSESSLTDRGGIPDVIEQAFRQASTRVLSQPPITHSLQRFLPQQPPPAEQSEPYTEPLTEEGYGHLLVNANVAKVLTSLTQFRFLLAEYFAIHNEWPVSLDEIDKHEQSLEAINMASSLELRYAGVLHVNLKDSVFPGGHVLQMLPTWDAGSGQILWECRTTVKSTVSACKQY